MTELVLQVWVWLNDPVCKCSQPPGPAAWQALGQPATYPGVGSQSFAGVGWGVARPVRQVQLMGRWASMYLKFWAQRAVSVKCFNPPAARLIAPLVP